SMRNAMTPPIGGAGSLSGLKRGIRFAGVPNCRNMSQKCWQRLFMGKFNVRSVPEWHGKSEAAPGGGVGCGCAPPITSDATPRPSLVLGAFAARNGSPATASCDDHFAPSGRRSLQSRSHGFAQRRLGKVVIDNHIILAQRGDAGRMLAGHRHGGDEG